MPIDRDRISTEIGYRQPLRNMPKERRNRSASFEARSHPLPFPCSSSSHHRGSSSSSTRNPPQSPTEAAKDIKDWDEIRCSVCMEHPHNAVLLICSSSNKGCQPFMCDTSYRHSNCLDQYQKLFSSNEAGKQQQQPRKLSCPLCRGEVTGWTVVEPARLYMNSKHRNCSMESCGFTGAYRDLRKHARVEHPSVRPFKADPERERDWRRMEQQRDIGDLVSTMRSAMGGGEDDVALPDVGDDPASSNNPLQTIHVIFVFRVSGTGGTDTGRTSVRYSRAQSLTGSRQGQGRATILWGETFNEPPEPAVIVDSSGGGGDDDEDELLPRRTRTRPRRQLRLSDDDDDAVINFDFDNDDLLSEE